MHQRRGVALALPMPREDQADQTEQSQQARRRSQHRTPATLAGGLQAQMGAGFFEGDFARTTPGKTLDHPLPTAGRIGAVKPILPTAGLIVHEDPADGNQASAVVATASEPVAGGAEQLHVAA